MKINEPNASSVANGEITLHYRVFGSGFPILLLSGGPGGPSEELRPIADHLRRDYQAVLLDQRGTGRSTLADLNEKTITMANYVADVETVRQHLGIERWVILGHSAGGALAMTVAATHPRRVAGLILVESAGVNLDFIQHAGRDLRHTDEDKAVMQRWADPERLAAEPDRGSIESYRAFVSGAVFDRASASDVMAHFIPAPNVSVISELMMKNLTSTRFDLRKDLASFQEPSLVIAGRQGLMGYTTSEQTSASLPNSLLRILEDCGHYPMYERPAEFYREVDAFMKEHFRLTLKSKGGD